MRRVLHAATNLRIPFGPPFRTKGFGKDGSLPLTKKKMFWVGWLPPAALIALCLTAFCAWYWKQTSQYESSAYADVSWSIGGRPYIFSCTVLDAEDNPVPNVSVSFLSNSGWTPSGGATDAQGCIEVRSGEYDVQGIRVNGKQIMNRPSAYWLNEPDVSRGLKVMIVLKEPLLRHEMHQDN